MAYFDNAATSYPKPEAVYDFMNEYYRNHGGSVGRGNYAMANSAKSLTNETRKLIREILHSPSKEVIFTPTATIALNIIIQGIISTGIKTVYISPFEHNAVTRILHNYESKDQITVEQLAVSDSLEFDMERIRYQFEDKRPELLIMSHASNVIGLVAPIENIFALAKEYGALTLVDMAQTAGLIDLNVGLETIDFAVFAGHKTLLGPTGISGFLMKPEIELPSVFFGGTGFDSANQNMPDTLPERFEMGTLNIAGVAGLNAALRWIRERTPEELYKKELANRNRLLEIIDEYNFIKPVGIAYSRKYVGIVSCLMDGISSDSAGGIFAEYGISVRTGLQCAPLAHMFLGTYPAGTIRFSVSALTSERDFGELRSALEKIEGEML